MWIFFALVGFVVGQIVAWCRAIVAAALAGKSGQLSNIAKLAVPPEWYIVLAPGRAVGGVRRRPWLASRVRGTRHFVADLGLRFRWIDLAGHRRSGSAARSWWPSLYRRSSQHIKNFNGPDRPS